jgi:hypothetical protein
MSPARANPWTWLAAPRQRHFVVAAVILAVAAVGWSWTVNTLKWALQKEAVPWPAGVVVRDDFSLEGLTAQMGPFRMVQGDGVLDRDERGELRLDGRPDGDIRLEDKDVMDSLGVGTSADQMRRPGRQSNWYCIRIYEDTRPAAPCRYWQLEVYYYTGGLDTVPHVPERCLVAGGATVPGGQTVRFEVPQAAAPWDSVPVERVGYEQSDRSGMQTRPFVQYYVFSLNGEPESSWEMVRGKLMDPRLRRCYFAKIQFAPLVSMVDAREADQAAGEFFAAVAPRVLKLLPTSRQVAQADSAGKESQQTTTR